jgi:hypothetical protein
MRSLGRVGHLLRGTLRSMIQDGVQLNETAERLLKEAQDRGYRVSRVKSMGTEAILMESTAEGKIYLWSSDDVLEHAKSKKWL